MSFSIVSRIGLTIRDNYCRQVDPEIVQQQPIPQPEPAPEEEQFSAATTDLAAQQIKIMTMFDDEGAVVEAGQPSADASEAISDASEAIPHDEVPSLEQEQEPAHEVGSSTSY